uniref:N-acetylmuramoyl-L-alanine amidase n=1 Tax=Caudovirales sp. gcode 4 TaxID=2838363 RepID=A0A8S5RT46_9CAUD|nr:MAG TPA: N-acetylmuramoyl-L-alanine amidase [Caudovirales sp. gcode 4]
MKLVKDNQTANFFANKVNTCEYIVLHHTGKGQGINIVNYLCRKESGVSAHYVVDIDGTVYQLAEDKKCTRHAGVSAYQGKTGLNLYSIGIEVVSDGYSFTDAQREATRELVRSLMQAHNIPSSKIIRHKDIAPGRKRDIGDNFRNNQFSTFAEYQKSFDQKEAKSLTPEAEEARKLGIWNGLDPDKPATREQVAMMIYRAAKLNN